MNEPNNSDNNSEDGRPVAPLCAAPGKILTPEARRALEEAAERRAREAEDARPVELGGPSGKEPTRYGDWERKGVVSDF